jgi:neutral ceramidase
MLWEQKMNPNGTLPGMGDWIGAIAQSNEGDVSPNTRGAFCDNGSPCDVRTTSWNLSKYVRLTYIA